MAYDEDLAKRMRETLAPRAGEIVEKKMFGGLAFMLNGNMSVGTMSDAMMVRVGPDAYDEMLEREYANKTYGNFRAMNGYVFIDAAGLEDDEDLAAWIELGLDFADTLPPK